MACLNICYVHIERYSNKLFVILQNLQFDVYHLLYVFFQYYPESGELSLEVSVLSLEQSSGFVVFPVSLNNHILFQQLWKYLIGLSLHSKVPSFHGESCNKYSYLFQSLQSFSQSITLQGVVQSWFCRYGLFQGFWLSFSRNLKAKFPFIAMRKYTYVSFLSGSSHNFGPFTCLFFYKMHSMISPAYKQVLMSHVDIFACI